MATCNAHDEHYYNLHPNELQKAIVECSKNQSAQENCEQLKETASQVNKLAYQLRLDPQEFGKKILSLQEKIAKQEASLRDASHPPELESLLIKNKQHLKERLAIVKWLESPAS